jgi:uncharacterized protein
VENFVATELMKLLSFSDIRANLLHFRTSNNKEVDFVLERPDESLAGVEVKTADHVPKINFICSLFFCTGKDIVPFGENVPPSYLWQ